MGFRTHWCVAALLASPSSLLSPRAGSPVTRRPLAMGHCALWGVLLREELRMRLVLVARDSLAVRKPCSLQTVAERTT